MKTRTILLAAIPFLALMPLLAPTLALANSTQIHSDVWNITILQGPLVTCTGTGTTQCTSVCDLIFTVANVIYYFIAVVIWIITPIMFLWSGILFLASRGNPEQVSKARKMITGTVIGVLIVLCAYLLVYVFVHFLQITNFVEGFGSGAC